MTPAELASLHERCFETPRPWSEAEFKTTLESRGVFLITRPSGFLLGRALAGECELLTLAVAPAARRQGVAADLMGSFFMQSEQRSAGELFLEVAENNRPARALYEKYGFFNAGKRPGYYRTPTGARVNAIIMRAEVKLDTERSGNL